VYVVRDPADVPGIARLGPDPLDPAFTVETLAGLLAGRRTQIKGVLRDQSIIAGIGNAYSDEVLHVARMSPYALAASLTPADVQGLYDAMQSTLEDAVATASGKPPADLKDAKRRGMRVHGRRGEACPVCGDTVRSVFFADNSLEYCATCQTGGKVLADRRLSRLLK
jgi:formamidopyrimidine-DNA glycosylase